MRRDYTYRLKQLLLAAGITEVVWWAVFLPIWFQVKDDPTFRFEKEDLLFGFLLIPVMFGAFYYIYRWKNIALRRFTETKLASSVTQAVSNSGMTAKYIAIRLAIGFLVIAAANPQYGEGEEKAKAEGAEIMMLVDVSRSMQAMDLSETRSRLDVAKLAMKQLMRRLDGDRVGIVVFAADAYLHLPITEDYAAARLFIDQISTDMLSAQGTSIGSAITKAMESFDFKNGMKKGIILISDGENHEGSAMTALQEAIQKDVVVHTVGMGSPMGATIPVYNSNGVKTGNLRDDRGNTVLTKLNEEMLKGIAAQGGGSYIRATETSLGLDYIKGQIDKIEKTEYASEQYTDFDDQFQWFLGMGILFVIVEASLSTKRSPWRTGIKIFEE